MAPVSGAYALLSWLTASVIFSGFQSIFVLTSAVSIAFDLLILVAARLVRRVVRIFVLARPWRLPAEYRRYKLRAAMRDARSWEDWAAAAGALDKLEGNDNWRRIDREQDATVISHVGSTGSLAGLASAHSSAHAAHHGSSLASPPPPLSSRVRGRGGEARRRSRAESDLVITGDAGATLAGDHGDEESLFDSALVRRTLAHLRLLRVTATRGSQATSATTGAGAGAGVSAAGVTAGAARPRASSRSVEADAVVEMMGMLRTCLNRNFGGLSNGALYRRSHIGTKHLVEKFYDELERCLDVVAEAGTDDPSGISFSEKAHFFEGARQALGRSALCLSGGGALSMVHMGVVRLLIERGLMPRVISGTSGGSIVAGVLALHTDKEMLEEICTQDISNKHGVRWFEPMTTQLFTFARTMLTKGGVRMMESNTFADTCRAYYKDVTFGEAFRRTGRHVSITITVAPSAAPRAAHPLILNHKTAPDVLVWSAVAASCALPGLMRPVTLMSKTRRGEEVPFHPAGVQTLDGSVHSDIPADQLAHLFRAQRFIVSQVNPHVVPFLKEPGAAAAQSRRSPIIRWCHNAEYYANLNVQQSLVKLAKLRMIPRIFGAEMGAIFLQRYAGHVTLVPRMSLLDTFKALSHPTETDMARYLEQGQACAFPAVCAIRDMLCIEQKLDECVAKFPFSRRVVSPEPPLGRGARAASDDFTVMAAAAGASAGGAPTAADAAAGIAVTRGMGAAFDRTMARDSPPGTRDSRAVSTASALYDVPSLRLATGSADSAAVIGEYEPVPADDIDARALQGQSSLLASHHHDAMSPSPVMSGAVDGAAWRPRLKTPVTDDPDAGIGAALMFDDGPVQLGTGRQVVGHRSPAAVTPKAQPRTGAGHETFQQHHVGGDVGVVGSAAGSHASAAIFKLAGTNDSTRSSRGGAFGPPADAPSLQRATSWVAAGAQWAGLEPYEATEVARRQLQRRARSGSV